MKKTHKTKWMAVLVSMAMTMEQTALAGIPITPGELLQGIRETPVRLQLEIPSDLAQIDEIFLSRNPSRNQMIFHIQDAHTNPEAQKKTHEILKFLNTQYGVKNLLLEGASGELEPEAIEIFKEDSLNARFAEALSKEGEITGAELYLVQNKEKVQGRGIEDIPLYRANYEALKSVFEKTDESKAFLDAVEMRLDKNASLKLGEEARKLLEEWKRFKDGRREFLPYIRNLSEDAKKYLELDLTSLFSQLEWPQLVRMLAIQSMEKEVNIEKARQEKETLVKFLKTKPVPANLIRELEAFPVDGRILYQYSSGKGEKDGPRYLLEKLSEKASPHGFYFYQYPAFSLYAGYMILSSEIETRVLFKEIETLFQKILDKLVTDARGRTLLELIQDEIRLRKLLTLELSREEWEDVISRRSVLIPESIVKRMEDLEVGSSKLEVGRNKTGSGSLLRTSNLQLPTSASVFENAIKFYEHAIQREFVFYQHTQSILEKSPDTRVALITGGFHTEGLSRQFREGDYSYVTLTPRFNATTNPWDPTYRDQMLQTKKSVLNLSFIKPTAGDRLQQPVPYGKAVPGTDQATLAAVSSLMTNTVRNAMSWDIAQSVKTWIQTAMDMLRLSDPEALWPYLTAEARAEFRDALERQPSGSASPASLSKAVPEGRRLEIRERTEKKNYSNPVQEEVVRRNFANRAETRQKIGRRNFLKIMSLAGFVTLAGGGYASAKAKQPDDSLIKGRTIPTKFQIIKKATDVIERLKQEIPLEKRFEKASEIIKKLILQVYPDESKEEQAAMLFHAIFALYMESEGLYKIQRNDQGKPVFVAIGHGQIEVATAVDHFETHWFYQKRELDSDISKTRAAEGAYVAKRLGLPDRFAIPEFYKQMMKKDRAGLGRYLANLIVHSDEFDYFCMLTKIVRVKYSNRLTLSEMNAEDFYERYYRTRDVEGEKGYERIQTALALARQFLWTEKMSREPQPRQVIAEASRQPREVSVKPLTFLPSQVSENPLASPEAVAPHSLSVNVVSHAAMSRPQAMPVNTALKFRTELSLSPQSHAFSIIPEYGTAMPVIRTRLSASANADLLRVRHRVGLFLKMAGFVSAGMLAILKCAGVFKKVMEAKTFDRIRPVRRSSLSPHAVPSHGAHVVTHVNYEQPVDQGSGALSALMQGFVGIENESRSEMRERAEKKVNVNRASKNKLAEYLQALYPQGVNGKAVETIADEIIRQRPLSGYGHAGEFLGALYGKVQGIKNSDWDKIANEFSFRISRRGFFLASILGGTAGLGLLGYLGKKVWKSSQMASALKSGDLNRILAAMWNDSEDPRIRSSEATKQLTGKLVEMNPDFMAARQIKILYPGAGDHVTPLEIAHALIQKGKIDQAEYIFTEIDDKYARSVQAILESLAHVGFYQDLKVEEKQFQTGKEIIFRFLDQGKPITLRYALNRSGESYWAPEYLKQANLVYYHDIDLYALPFLTQLWRDYFGDNQKRGDLVLFMEDLETSGNFMFKPGDKNWKTLPLVRMRLFGNVDTVQAGYGHRSWMNPVEEAQNPESLVHEERGPYRNSAAAVVMFDKELLRGMSEEEYRMIADFQAVAAAGLIHPDLIQGIDARNDAQQLTDWINAVGRLVFEKIVMQRAAKDAGFQAKWVTALIQYYWVIYRQLQKAPDFMPFPYWFRTRCPRISEFEAILCSVRENLPRQVENYERGKTWNRDAAEFFFYVFRTKELLSVQTREWIYHRLSDALKEDHLRIVETPGFLEAYRKATGKPGLMELLGAIERIKLFGIGRFDKDFKTKLQSLPDLLEGLDPADKPGVQGAVDKALQSIAAIEKEVPRSESRMLNTVQKDIVQKIVALIKKYPDPKDRAGPGIAPFDDRIRPLVRLLSEKPHDLIELKFNRILHPFVTEMIPEGIEPSEFVETYEAVIDQYMGRFDLHLAETDNHLIFDVGGFRFRMDAAAVQKIRSGDRAIAIELEDSALDWVDLDWYQHKEIFFKSFILDILTLALSIKDSFPDAQNQTFHIISEIVRENRELLFRIVDPFLRELKVNLEDGSVRSLRQLHGSTSSPIELPRDRKSRDAILKIFKMLGYLPYVFNKSTRDAALQAYQEQNFGESFIHLQRVLFRSETRMEFSRQKNLAKQRYEDELMKELRQYMLDDSGFVSVEEHRLTDLMNFLNMSDPTMIMRAIRRLGQQKVLRYPDNRWTSFLEVTDAEGNPTGILKSYWAIHRDGDWRRSGSVLGITWDGKLVIQQRKSGQLDMTAAGQIEPGYSVQEGQARETWEELELDERKVQNRLIPVLNPMTGEKLFRSVFRDDFQRLPYWDSDSVYHGTLGIGEKAQGQKVYSIIDELALLVLTPDETNRLERLQNPQEDVYGIEIVTPDALFEMFDQGKAFGVGITPYLASPEFRKFLKKWILEQLQKKQRQELREERVSHVHGKPVYAGVSSSFSNGTGLKVGFDEEFLERVEKRAASPKTVGVIVTAFVLPGAEAAESVFNELDSLDPKPVSPWVQGLKDQGLVGDQPGWVVSVSHQLPTVQELRIIRANLVNPNQHQTLMIQATEENFLSVKTQASEIMREEIEKMKAEGIEIQDRFHVEVVLKNEDLAKTLSVLSRGIQRKLKAVTQSLRQDFMLGQSFVLVAQKPILDTLGILPAVLVEQESAWDGEVPAIHAAVARFSQQVLQSSTLKEDIRNIFVPQVNRYTINPNELRSFSARIMSVLQAAESFASAA